MSSRQFTQFILGLFFLASSSYAFSNAEFTYNVIDGGIEITGCADSCPSDLVIPEVIDGYVVTSIGLGAFYRNQLTSVMMPDSVNNIGNHAFDDNQLTTVTIPNSVTSIGEGAFVLNHLTSVTIPDSVTSIGRIAFTDNQLTTVIVPNSVTSIKDGVFANNQLTNLTIPDSVISIEAGAFFNNQLTNLTIPDSVTSIEQSAFANNVLNSILFLGEPPILDVLTFADNLLITVTYCQNESEEWNSIVIEGITPELDESCDNSDSQYATFDIDQSGSVDALSDGLILLRYFFGLRGDSLISGVISPNANRTSSADIEAYIESHMP